MQASKSILDYGERLATALLGVDALYREESGDDEGLVVLNLDHAGLLTPESFRSYDEANTCFGQLKKEAGLLPEKDRIVYYDKVCHSTLAYITWRSRGLPFLSQLRDFLHVTAQPASDKALDELRRRLTLLLNRMGYSGDLVSQCRDWENNNRVASDDVPDVLRGLLDEAWDRTEELLFTIPADHSDGMQVVPVSGVSFNAQCNYNKRQIELNVDPILTRQGLKHLAVHEGYPGHYVQFKVRETLFGEGQAPADVLLSVVNTASSSVFEGIADTGMAMLNWIESDDDRVALLLNRYRSGIGTGAAWRLHELDWSEDRVYKWLSSQALTGGEGWVENRIGFISAPSRAVLIWSYWCGEDAVAPVWNRLPVKDRPGFLHYLYGRMHANATVSMYAT